ncbi:MAG: hypothetical protein L0Z50_31805, partial [Verrucomicrobiales bacterium]|nr:hypothetical protein [Verrucomicrobiales bacterium]
MIGTRAKRIVGPLAGLIWPESGLICQGGSATGASSPVPSSSSSTDARNAALTPWRRLYLATTFSYTQSRIVSGVNERGGLVPYDGDIYSVL